MDENTGISSNTDRLQFEFKGDSLEYFRIWIVNITLSILTLGIYSAWAKVRTKRYFYRNLKLQGSAFEYHAQPVDILKGRLVVVGVFLFYVALEEIIPLVSLPFLLLFWFTIPWLIVRAHSYNARNSSWRNIRFGFRQDVMSEAVRIFALFPILLPFTLFMIAPYLSFRRWKFSIGNALLGETPFIFSARVSSYYSVMLSSGIFVIIIFLIIAVISNLLPPPSVVADGTETLGGIVLVASFPVLYMAGHFIYRVLARNIALNGSTVGGHQLESTLSVWGLGWIYLTNTILIVATAGLMTPWAKVRVAHYLAEHLFLHLHGDLDSFIQDGSQEDKHALGEEGADFMDVDIGGI